MYTHIMFHVRSTSTNMHESDLPRICAYVSGIINNLNGIPIAVNGITDHIHILATLPKTISLSQFVRTIKTESTMWLKRTFEYYDKFSWQDGYGAFSVSASNLDRTKNYVMNQAEHHKKISFYDEYKKIADAYEIEYDEKYAFAD